MADPAERQKIYQTLSPVLAQIPSYMGQEPPDDYCNKIEQGIAFADTMINDINNAHNGTFTDAHKADIYKSKMSEKYLPVPVQFAGNNIDTPARFRAWLEDAYRQRMIGTQ